MNSLKRHEGYLMIDHRFSPGLPEDLSREMGLDPRYTGEGKLFEQATLTCSHCKCAYIKNPMRIRERAYCVKCNHYICDVCAAESHQPLYSHLPFEKLADMVMDGVVLGSNQQLLSSTGKPL